MYSPIFLRYSFLQKVVIFVHNLRAFLRGHSEKFEACRSLAGEMPLERFCFGERVCFRAVKGGRCVHLVLRMFFIAVTRIDCRACRKSPTGFSPTLPCVIVAHAEKARQSFLDQVLMHTV
jgi:hypothetical protein